MPYGCVTKALEITIGNKIVNFWSCEKAEVTLLLQYYYSTVEPLYGNEESITHNKRIAPFSEFLMYYNNITKYFRTHIDDLVQDCSNSSALAIWHKWQLREQRRKNTMFAEVKIHWILTQKSWRMFVVSWGMPFSENIVLTLNVWNCFED